MTDDSTTDLPDPGTVIRETDWAALECGFGDPHQVSAGLRDLLHPDPAIRREAQRGLRGAFHDEAGDALPTTVPTAACLAGLLADPHAADALDLPDPDNPGRSMRAALLDRLGHYFLSADDRTCASSGHGPSETALRRLRPAVYRVVAPLLDAEDRAVRHASVFTAVSLVKHPRLARHRAELADHALRLLEESDHSDHRDVALDGLRTWGHDTGGLETEEDRERRLRLAVEPPF
ncbi:hypothetical protein ACFU7Y_27445 [Kitasatospora sp. NPDC057542]|uniref:hypothetical protein n=1 Tax=Kitasatospora sp. NPDC057542 TaxID=3346162 RepID=UPI0036C604A1